MRKLPLILAAIIMPSCAVIVVSSIAALLSSRSSLARAESSLSETKMAEAYSCAYVAGQYAIMNRLPAIFAGPREAPAYCEPFKAMAAKHGFKQ